MSISDRILKFRTSKGMTHQAFADAVGVSRGAVQQWERGITAPKRKNQPAVAAFMGISESELMSSTASANLTAPSPLVSAQGGGAMESNVSEVKKRASASYY